MGKLTIAGSVMVLGLTSAAFAQDGSNKPDIVVLEQKAADKGLFAFDYGVPSSPATRLLDQAADKVQAATSLKPFILSLPSILSGGEQGQSIALDVAPAWLASGPLDNDYFNYTTGSAAYRAFLRTHLNLAIYEGVKDNDVNKSQKSRLAVGFSSSLLDSSDPLMAKANSADDAPAWQGCLNRNQEELRKAHETMPPKKSQRYAVISERVSVLVTKKYVSREILSEAEDAELKLLQAEREEIIEAENIRISSIQNDKIVSTLSACTKAANQAARYGMSLEVGGGMVWHGDPGKLSGFEDAGSVLWASYRYPMGVLIGAPKDSLLRYWVVGASARIGFNEFVKTGNKTTPEVRADTWDAWGGLEHLSENNRLALQAGYQSRDSDNAVPDFDRKRWRYQASYTQLVEKESGIWIKLAYGYVDQKGDDDKSVLISLTFSPPDASNLFGLGK